MNILELAILKKMVGGGGGSGTDNYNDLSNLPQINGETLAGNKTAENLGLQDALTFDSAPTKDSTNPVESGGVYNALAGKQDNLTFDDDPTENSTNPVKSGGVYSALAGKQDNLTFDGVYNASTNKAATELTVTNAIAGLDVSDFSVDADETISSISETDGKINVTKQDIAIASNQVTAMTGYTKPSSAPATPAIQTSDTANQAFGKLEFKTDTNQTNIWSVQNKVGKNLLNFKAWSEVVPVNKGTKTVSDNAITLTATDDDCYTKYGALEYPQDVRIKVNPGDVLTLSWNYSAGSSQSDDKVYIFGYNETEPPLSNANVSSQTGYLQYTVPANAKFCTFRLGVTTSGNTATYSNIMICDKAVYDQDSSFQPYGAPNYDLTYLEAEDRASLAEVVDSGAKNLLQLEASTGSTSDLTVTWNNSEGYVQINGTCNPTSPNPAAYIRICTWIVPANGYYKLSAVNAENSDIYVYDNANWSSLEHSATYNSIAYLTKGTTKMIFLRVISGYVANNLKVYPMICTKAAFDVSQKFVPYRPNWDLVAALAQNGGFIDSTLGSIITNADLNSIDKTTFAVYNEPANLPSGITGYCYVRTSVFDENSALQELYVIQPNPVSFFRIKLNNSWTVWVQTSNA